MWLAWRLSYIFGYWDEHDILKSQSEILECFQDVLEFARIYSLPGDWKSIEAERRLRTLITSAVWLLTKRPDWDDSEEHIIKTLGLKNIRTKGKLTTSGYSIWSMNLDIKNRKRMELLNSITLSLSTTSHNKGM